MLTNLNKLDLKKDEQGMIKKMNDTCLCRMINLMQKYLTQTLLQITLYYLKLIFIKNLIEHMKLSDVNYDRSPDVCQNTKEENL